MSELSICLVNAYFGRLPDYFPVWLKSCRNNPTIDFILFTDQDPCCDPPPNVRFIPLTMAQFSTWVSKALGFEVSLETPFKVCDFKPGFGLIFQDLLVSYDYWGHCDIDLIWGDLRSFFEQYHLEQYDKFLPLGHLSLYRNTYENNRRFMDEPGSLSNYRTVFQRKQNYLFDELAIVRIYKNHYPFFDKIIFADIWPSKRRYTMCTSLSYYPSIYKDLAQRYQPVNFKEQIFLWSDGKIYQYYISNSKVQRREFLYIHVQKRDWRLIGDFSDHMIISRNQVRAIEATPLDIPRLISEYNPYSWLEDRLDDAQEFILHCWSYFKRKVIRIEPIKIVVEK